MRPAEISNDIRRQRERVVAAESQNRKLETELSDAEHEAERLRTVHAELSVTPRQ